jgi:phosphoglycolate phosphatase-like HAD superfamily hydrolase
VKTVLFDLDGVITSERIYWNCSGLAYARYMGMEVPTDEMGKIMLAQRLIPDTVIKRFKELGINSNWDITYANSVLASAKRDVGWFLDEMEKRGMTGMDYINLLDEVDPSEKHDREGGPWEKAHRDFQKCYYELGHTDEPVIPIEKIRKALEELKDMGFKLGIVTGRPREEAKRPLDNWGILDYFEPNVIITDKEVSEESKKEGRHIGKPDPWPILRAIFNHEGSGDFSKKRFDGKYFFVGDSISDIMAAKNAGIPVICVDTGIASTESLKKAGADYIVKDVSKIPEILKKIAFS